MYLNEEQRDQIRQLNRNLEKSTGVEIMTAVVGKCDTYPEIPWKAFALGAALNAMLAVGYGIMAQGWPVAWVTLILISWVLGAGAVAALLTTLWPAFARLFLDGERAQSEARQYAQGLFLEHALFQTGSRQAVLLLIGCFEHQVVILPDSGVESRLTIEALDDIIQQMLPHLRRSNHYQALAQGISGIQAALLRAGFEATADRKNQIPDAVIQQTGGQP